MRVAEGGVEKYGEGYIKNKETERNRRCNRSVRAERDDIWDECSCVCMCFYVCMCLPVVIHYDY